MHVLNIFNVANVSFRVHLSGMQVPHSGKEAACGALVNLSAKTDVNKFAIAAAGGLEPLVALLDFGNPEATNTSYECASAALCNLAFNNGNRVKIAAAGAIPRLVKVTCVCIAIDVVYGTHFFSLLQVMASSPTPEAAEYATHALGSLACEINANATAIVQVSSMLVWLLIISVLNNTLPFQAGAVPLLLNCIRDGSAWAKEAAARTLRNLTFFQNLKQQLKDAGAVEILSKLTESGTARAAESARAALNHLGRAPEAASSSSQLTSSSAEPSAGVVSRRWQTNSQQPQS